MRHSYVLLAPAAKLAALDYLSTWSTAQQSSLIAALGLRLFLTTSQPDNQSGAKKYADGHPSCIVSTQVVVSGYRQSVEVADQEVAHWPGGRDC
jgi:hypothetical protein